LLFDHSTAKNSNVFTELSDRVTGIMVDEFETSATESDSAAGDVR